MLFLSSNEEWIELIKDALKHWHKAVTLNTHALAELNIVSEQYQSMTSASTMDRRAKALREVLRTGIRSLSPDLGVPPVEEDDPKWSDPSWRYYCILTLHYIKALPHREVQSRILMGDGNWYYVIVKRAMELLASTLREWEGIPVEQILDFGPRPLGAVELTSKYYVKRSADLDLTDELGQSRAIVTIRGSRQVGKTSLLLRGIDHAKHHYDATSVILDLQSIEKDSLNSLEHFLLELAYRIAAAVGLNEQIVSDIWERQAGTLFKMTNLMERYILPHDNVPILLALDEVDRLMLTDYHNEFFGLIRSWFNWGALDPQWKKLKVLMVISTEPYLLIKDPSQSPFNVGLSLHLSDFDSAQVQDLNQRYGSPLDISNLPQFMDIFGGHPFLTRTALYTMGKKQLSLDKLLSIASTDKGPFREHLNYQMWLVREDLNLQAALRQIVYGGQCSDVDACRRLLKAGLVRKDDEAYTPRCGLYQTFFSENL